MVAQAWLELGLDAEPSRCFFDERLRSCRSAARGGREEYRSTSPGRRPRVSRSELMHPACQTPNESKIHERTSAEIDVSRVF